MIDVEAGNRFPITGLGKGRLLGTVGMIGIPFDPGAAEWWNRNSQSGWQYEAFKGKVNLGLDQSNAHVQPSGAYHYHAMPNGLIKALGNGKKMLLVGYAADGFPIYARYAYQDPKDSASGVKAMRSSYQLKKGTRPSGPGGAYDGTFVQDYEYVAGSGDLDECNGRTGVTPEYPESTYYYMITDDFPYISRKYRGTPDPSFRRGGPPGQGAGQGRGFRPPPPRGGHRPPPPR